MDRRISELKEHATACPLVWRENSAEEARVKSLKHFASFLERAEQKFQTLIGVPFAASSIFNQRSSFIVSRTHFTVGRFAAILRDRQVPKMLMKFVLPSVVPFHTLQTLNPKSQNPNLISLLAEIIITFFMAFPRPPGPTKRT